MVSSDGENRGGSAVCAVAGAGFGWAAPARIWVIRASLRSAVVRSGVRPSAARRIADDSSAVSRMACASASSATSCVPRPLSFQSATTDDGGC